MPQIVTSNVAYGHVSTAHFFSRTRHFVDINQAPVVQTLDRAVDWENHNPAD